MMIRSTFFVRSFLACSNKFPMSSKITSLRLLHHQSAILKFYRSHKCAIQYEPHRGKRDYTNVSTLFKPVPIKSNPHDIDIGAELTGKLEKGEVLKILNKFTQKAEIKMLCLEHGLDGKRYALGCGYC